MGFSGRIEDLPLVDLFQYLSAGKKDGTCIVRQGKEQSYVYFHEGNVVHAISPHRHNIGDILINANKLDLKTLQKALVAQTGEQKGKNIGQILVEMGAVSPNQLKIAIQMQLKGVIQHLVTWTHGEFSFENNEIIPVDDINLNPTKVIPKSTRYTTPQLLMEVLGEKDNPDGDEEESAAVPYRVPSGREEKHILEESSHPPVASNETEAIKNNTSVMPAEVGDPPNGAPPVSMDKKGVILLLTGDGIFKNLLREGLQNLGYSVGVASSVEDCLAKGAKYIKKGESPIYLTDYRLPGTGRSEKTAGVRILGENEKTAGHCEVIAMTEPGDSKAEKKLKSISAQNVVSKPSRKAKGNSGFPGGVKHFCSALNNLIQHLPSYASTR